MQATPGLTGIILAGGESSRFGSPKALALFRGRPLIECVAAALGAACDSLLVVRAAGAPLLPLPASGAITQVQDDVRGRGPLAGIVAGMAASPTALCFVTSCDAPLLQPSLVVGLAERSSGFDAVCPRVGGRLQPLAAIYRIPAVLPAFERALAAGQLRVSACVQQLNTRFVDDDELREFDPQLDSFRTANTPDELRALEAYVRDRAPAREGPGSLPAGLL